MDLNLLHSAFNILLKKLVMSSASSKGYSMAGKWPPAGNSDQC
jgi:hypothetical protein